MGAVKSRDCALASDLVKAKSKEAKLCYPEPFAARFALTRALRACRARPPEVAEI